MKAIILAAGRGERLEPITETRPKPLMPILCKPLLYWHLDALSRLNELDEVIIVVNYMKEAIEEAVKKHSIANKVNLVVQGKELGTGHAIKRVFEEKDLDDEVIVVYGDLFLSNWSIYERIARDPSKNIVVGVIHSDPREYGVLLVKDGFVKGIIEKPEKPPTNIVNAGIYKFDPTQLRKYVNELKPSVRGEYELTDVITSASRDGIKFKLITMDEREWMDIGRPWNLLDANTLALNNIENKIYGVVDDSVVIKGRVYVGKNSIIKSFTYIEGPVFIDEDVVIGPFTRIRPYTVVCRGSHIAFSVEIKNSLIMENVKIHHLAYIGDSIVCENVNIGAGTITANLRFDEKDVKMYIRGKRVSTGRRKFGAVIGGYAKTGINVSILPGRKIGSYSWIAPGAVVDVDVPSKSFYKTKIEHYIEPIRQ